MNIDAEEYHEEEAHNRFITVCILYDEFRGRIFMGMSICMPQDKEKVELGRQIAKGRARTNKGDSKSKVIVYPERGRNKLDSVLEKDRFFFKQIARSYFYDFKHNPQKYIASYETN